MQGDSFGILLLFFCHACRGVFNRRGVKGLRLKGKSNFNLPPPVKEAMDELSATLAKPKEKWSVITAAILDFLAKGRLEQAELVLRVRAEDGPMGDFQQMVEDARRVSAEQDAALPTRETVKGKLSRGERLSDAERLVMVEQSGDELPASPDNTPTPTPNPAAANEGGKRRQTGGGRKSARPHGQVK